MGINISNLGEAGRSLFNICEELSIKKEGVDLDVLRVLNDINERIDKITVDDREENVNLFLVNTKRFCRLINRETISKENPANTEIVDLATKISRKASHVMSTHHKDLSQIENKALPKDQEAETTSLEEMGVLWKCVDAIEDPLGQGKLLIFNPRTPINIPRDKLDLRQYDKEYEEKYDDLFPAVEPSYLTVGKPTSMFTDTHDLFGLKTYYIGISFYFASCYQLTNGNILNLLGFAHQTRPTLLPNDGRYIIDSIQIPDLDSLQHRWNLLGSDVQILFANKDQIRNGQLDVHSLDLKLIPKDKEVILYALRTYAARGEIAPLRLKPSEGIASDKEFIDAVVREHAVVVSSGVEFTHDMFFHVIPMIGAAATHTKDELDRLVDKIMQAPRERMAQLERLIENEKDTATDEQRLFYKQALYCIGAFVDAYSANYPVGVNAEDYPNRYTPFDITEKEFDLNIMLDPGWNRSFEKRFGEGIRSSQILEKMKSRLPI